MRSAEMLAKYLVFKNGMLRFREEPCPKAGIDAWQLDECPDMRRYRYSRHFTWIYVLAKSFRESYAGRKSAGVDAQSDPNVGAFMA